MTNPNDPAFATFKNDFVHGKQAHVWTYGLTKREYFAAMAMQGMMSLQPDRLHDWAGVEDLHYKTVGEWMAKNCVDAADALIAELNK